MIFTKRESPLLIFADKVWDRALHCAFTDLIRYKGLWLLVFRESQSHAESQGGIRILASQEGIIWRSIAFLIQEHIDFRDPKLSIMPNGSLMLLACGVSFNSSQKPAIMQSRVAFSQDGRTWSEFTKILDKHEWLWRVTWYRGIAYGVSYSFVEPSNSKSEWLTKLYESTDGIHYRQIVPWILPGRPNETAIQFTKDGQMVALVRREEAHNNHAWIGCSSSPYAQWDWVATNKHLGGPNFIILPSGKMLASGRMIANTPYGTIEKTMLARLSLNELTPTLVLPSGGDTGYPGMYYSEGYLWMSYYSSHEGNTSIYFAKIQLPSE